MADSNVPMRILYVAPTGIGDAVVTSGVLDHLIHLHPQSRITVACGPAAAGLFAGMPNLERIIVTRKRRLALHWLVLWREVITTSWDMVLDFKGSGLGYMVRARRRVLWPGRSDGPMFERCASMLSLSPAPMPVAWTSRADRARAQALLPGQGPFVALCPTASWKPKTWPADRMAALFRALSEGPLPGAVPVVLAGPGSSERDMASPLLAALPQAVDLCGALTLGEAAACIERCALYIGNDSGLTHVAAATGTATVGLYGAALERAAVMKPVGRAATWALASGASMAQLSVERAYEACVDMLGRAGRR